MLALGRAPGSCEHLAGAPGGGVAEVGGAVPTHLSRSQWAAAEAEAGGERGRTGRREARRPLASTQGTRRCWRERPLPARWCPHPRPCPSAGGAIPAQSWEAKVRNVGRGGASLSAGAGRGNEGVGAGARSREQRGGPRRPAGQRLRPPFPRISASRGARSGATKTAEEGSFCLARGKDEDCVKWGETGGVF